MKGRRVSKVVDKDEDDKEGREDDGKEEEENDEEVDISDLSDSDSQDTNDEDLSQISDEELEDGSIEDQPSRVSIRETKISDTDQSIYKISYSLILILIPIVVILFQSSSQFFSQKQDIVEKESEIQLNLAHVNVLDQKYPQNLSSKKMRIIKTRLAVMRKEVSILMLLGKSKDTKCRSDPTFCIGQTIANVTQVQYGYIDASNPRIKSREIEQELIGSLDGNKHAVMIDSLEKLPGPQVMNLFQFIDKDETHKRRGMLLFVVYTGDNRNSERLARMRDAEIAEKILLDKWSPSIPMDSLTSVISRICGSIVRIY